MGIATPTRSKCLGFGWRDWFAAPAPTPSAPPPPASTRSTCVGIWMERLVRRTHLLLAPRPQPQRRHGGSRSHAFCSASSRFVAHVRVVQRQLHQHLAIAYANGALDDRADKGNLVYQSELISLIHLVGPRGSPLARRERQRRQRREPVCDPPAKSASHSQNSCTN
jgi:hypothetical protein